MAGLPLVGDEFAGYRVRAVLGRGGMSVVYQAENLRLSSVIALKVLAPDLASDDVFRARFLEESRIAASLNHPNVIPIYDMGSQDDLLYIAMRYVSGTDMRQMIKKRGRILPATALFLVGQAARALDAAHRRGLVHRDVKPGNLLIERGADEDDPDHVYLADFGITKHAMSRSGLTSTGQFLGTIDYVAPEQIRGTSVLGLADQYSLGCVLYECLTGRVPFEKDLDAAIIWAHVEETPTMPTILRPELPPQIDEVFARVLAKQPSDRYGSCREFVQAAQQALGVFGPATESSLTYGPAAADPSTRPRGITPVSRPGVPPDQFSWSGRISQPSAPAPVAPDPVAPGSAPATPPTDVSPYYVPPPTAAQPSGSRHSGGTLASHRREYAVPDQGGPGQQAGPGLPSAGPPAGPPPREPRWYRRPRWIAVLAAVGLLLVGLGTWAGLKGSGSHHNAAPATSHKPKPKTSALMAALILANQSADGKGKLPPSTCKQSVPTVVTCTAPAPGITAAIFQTFPNQQALYNAYTAKVAALSPGHQFKQNFADCETQVTYGETGWNHLFKHTSKYTVDQMIMNKVTDDQAAGRVFCNYTQGLEYMVWTQNDGHLLGYVAGPVHTDVWDWWVRVHHNIGIGGSPMDMQMPGTSPSASPSMSGMSASPSMSPSMSPSASMSGTGG
ncbi:MAG TPA: protein kinase [Streptosporangiaceae bacterium]|nr:protein kinase [Streptosporangiaceae bacterium]